MGLASPQFHVRMDSTFQTMRRLFGEQLPLSKWQEKCHFTKVQETTPDFEGGKHYAKSTGSTTSPTGIQQQVNETDSQLEGHLPQESHLLSDIPTLEAGPEPAQQPQLTPDITNELVEGGAV
jgi:hypothetical protein